MQRVCYVLKSGQIRDNHLCHTPAGCKHLVQLIKKESRDASVHTEHISARSSTSTRFVPKESSIGAEVPPLRTSSPFTEMRTLLQHRHRHTRTRDARVPPSRCGHCIV
eukprot:2250022-Pyramimonas_sp.AAC.1